MASRDMCKHLVSEAYKRRIGSAVRKAVLTYLADVASPDGSGIWCSKGTIAAETEVGRTTVKATIKDFLSEGLLHETGRSSHSNGYTVEYALDVGALEALPRIKPPRSRTTRPDMTRSPTDPVTHRPGREAPQTRSPTDPQEGRPPTPNRKKTIKEPCAADGSASDFDFESFLDQFVEAYPRPGVRRDIELAMRRALDGGEDPDWILDGARQYRAQQEGNEARFISYPQNWIDGRRWTEFERTKSPEETHAALLESWAEEIRDGSPWAVRFIQATWVREILTRGLCTVEQIEAMGFDPSSGERR